MAEVRHTEARPTESPTTHTTEPRAAEARGTNTLPALIADLGRSISALLSKEAGLLRAEVDEKYSNLQTAGGSLIAAGICLVASLLILLQALIVALTNLGLGAGWSSLVVGLAVGAIGVYLLQQGRSLAGEGILPKRTQSQVQRDAELLKERIK